MLKYGKDIQTSIFPYIENDTFLRGVKRNVKTGKKKRTEDIVGNLQRMFNFIVLKSTHV